MMKTILAMIAITGLSMGAAGGELIRGMNLLLTHRGYDASLIEGALGPLSALGVEWVAIPVNSPHPPAHGEELVRLVAVAKAHGLKVLIVPRFPGAGSPGEGGSWATWFEAYRAFILGYARVAEEAEADMFCVGVELAGTLEGRREWRHLINAVREAYSGPLTYAAGWKGEMWKVPFWDALDYIGINAYYPLTGRFSPTLEELISAWSGPLRSLGCLARRVGKPVIFTEIGYRSVDGAARAPWDGEMQGKPDPEEQALCYRAFFEAVWGKEPWFAGAFFRHWIPDATAEGMRDTGFSPQGKPAEGILERYFGRP